jgi:transglutaminase-like putative cysteine protease
MRTLFLAAAIAAAYALLRGWPGGMPALVRIAAAVTVVAGALSLRGRRSSENAPAPAVSRRRAAWIDIMAATFAVLSVEAGFVAFLTLAPPRAESLATSLGKTLHPASENPQPTTPPAKKGSRPGNWLWLKPGARRLPRHADFQPGNRPEVFLRTRDRADAALLLRTRLYVTAFTLEQYSNGEWSAANTETPALLEADPAGFIRFPDRPGRPIAHEVFHQADPSGATPIIALQGMVSAEIPTLRDLGGGLRILPPPSPDAIGHQYLVVSKPLLLKDLPADASPHPAETTDPRLLEIPESGALGPRLRELAALAAGSGTPVERLGNLRNHLRTTLGYSLKFDNPDNLDPLENFLFHEQRGSCEMFATVGALLARALGVPSRIAYGWTGGRYFETPNLFVFRSREAHAWAEVWIEDYGWVVFDPTPPGALDSPAATVAAPDEPVPGDKADDSLAGGPDADGTAAEAPSPRAILVLLAALILPALGIAMFRSFGIRRRHAAESAAAAPQPFPTPGYLAAFRHAAARAGHPLPPGRPLRRHLAAMAENAPPAATALVDYHYATRYEFAAPDPAAERRLARALEKWRPPSS